MQDTTKNDDITGIFRQMVQHESEQIHRRVSWLGTFQGFLFAGLGFAWGKSSVLISVLSFVGMTIAFLVFLALMGATLALSRLRRDWLKCRPVEYIGPGIFGFYPEKSPFTAFTAPENLLPFVFIAAWIFVLVIK